MWPVGYDIVDAGSYTELVERVNDWMLKGWQPIGGITIDRWTEPSPAGMYTNRYCCFYQAMIYNVTQDQLDELRKEENA